MRRMITALIAPAALLCAAGPADAATVLDVTSHGVRAKQEPALDGPWSLGGPVPGARPPRTLTAPVVSLRTRAARTARKDLVKQTIKSAFAQGTIDAAKRDRYLGSWAAALRTYGGLRGQRRAELGYVIGTLRILAAQKRLGVRLAPLFLTLDRNREWWAKAGPPGSGARLRFGSSRVLFQYFPGEGLQLHPLGNFGQANGFWYAHRENDLRSLLEDLEAIAVDRGGFLTWEYYFAYGGGSPPWISGMAQGTAMQAYARASKRLTDPALLDVARRARGAFERRTPVGVHAPQGSQNWFALYSFAPRLNVLNGMLQAVNGVRTYTDFAPDDVAAQQIFQAGDKTAKAVVGQYDTGAWSLYDRPNGSPGHEANLNYHTLNRDFARNLCRATKAEAYCTAADNFTRYLTEDPTLDPNRAAPSPATPGKGVKFRFKLSKVGRVGIVVKDGGGKTFLSTSAPFARGDHYFRWIAPRRGGEQTYTYTLSARDLAGNSSSVTGDVRVRGKSGV
jgi:D-glucuronyl C5-epimerase-like protein